MAPGSFRPCPALCPFPRGQGISRRSVSHKIKTFGIQSSNASRWRISPISKRSRRCLIRFFGFRPFAKRPISFFLFSIRVFSRPFAVKFFFGFYSTSAFISKSKFNQCHSINQQGIASRNSSARRDPSSPGISRGNCKTTTAWTRKRGKSAPWTN